MQRKIHPPKFIQKDRAEFLEEQIQDWLSEVQDFLEAEGYRLVYRVVPKEDLEIRMEDLT
jgi:hypothetical protein